MKRKLWLAMEFTALEINASSATRRNDKTMNPICLPRAGHLGTGYCTPCSKN